MTNEINSSIDDGYSSDVSNKSAPNPALTLSPGTLQGVWDLVNIRSLFGTTYSYALSPATPVFSARTATPLSSGFLRRTCPSTIDVSNLASPSLSLGGYKQLFDQFSGDSPAAHEALDSDDNSTGLLLTADELNQEWELFSGSGCKDEDTKSVSTDSGRTTPPTTDYDSDERQQENVKPQSNINNKVETKPSLKRKHVADENYEAAPKSLRL